jgi:tetrapyrrole methylase family protein / MazG family protein
MAPSRFHPTGPPAVPPTAGPGPGKPVVVVVGLGPGHPGLVTAATLEAIASTPARWLRTSRHPSASLVPGAGSFDHIYDQATDLDAVYGAIVDALVAEASAAPGRRVLYAVPGSPLVAERTVELLRADGRVRTEVLVAVSFADLAFERLGVDPLAQGVRVMDGHRFAVEAAGYRGPALVGQCETRDVLSGVKLAIASVVEAGPPAPCPRLVLLQRLGLPDELVTELDWADLDRSVAPDHLTSVWVPALGHPFAPEMARLDELVRTLRARCPWDRQQTHQSLTRYLIEECYEVLEAVDELGDDGRGYEHLEEELGDVLFQVFFHSVLAAEEGQFTVADVARTVHDKLVGRHPHVFGDVEAATAEDVLQNWEVLKRREKGRQGLMDGIAGNLPALVYAHKVQRKAASVGFDWAEPGGALDKVHEELGEVRESLAPGQGPERAREELGDLLFAVVNVARHLHVDPEAALREATVKFKRRFTALEVLAERRGADLSALGLAGLDALWEEVKAAPPG